MTSLHENLAMNATLAQRILSEVIRRTTCRCRACRIFGDNSVGLCDRNYFPLGNYDEENNHFTDDFFAIEPKRIFDITRSKFAKYFHSELQPLEELRLEFIDFGGQNVQSGGRGLHGIEFLFRHFPLTWSDFIYLNIPIPRQSGNLAVAFLEHTDGQRVAEADLTENERYNKILKGNVKFGLFYRHLEMSEAITGFYRGPKQFGDRQTWTDIWKMIKNDRSSVSKFIKRLCIESNTDHTDFLRFVKNEITSMYTNLRLDQPKIWEQEQSLYIEVLLYY